MVVLLLYVKWLIYVAMFHMVDRVMLYSFSGTNILSDVYDHIVVRCEIIGLFIIAVVICDVLAISDGMFSKMCIANVFLMLG